MDIRKLLRQMTLEEKIGQLTQYNANLFTESAAEETGPARRMGLTAKDLSRVGNVLNFVGVAEMKRIQDAHMAQDPNGIPMLFMMDVIHGFRTIYPIPLGLACSFDPSLAERCAEMAAEEAAAGGVHVTFTPMVDYARDARWGRVMETGGEEPLVTGAMGAAQVRGFQGTDLRAKDHIATCVKHYAGYGGAEAGRDYNLVELSPRELWQHYLPAYKDCLDAGAEMVMPSFNALNGVPSVANDLLMRRILREMWGFDGVVVSDYNAVGELLVQGVAADEREAATLAFSHGCDIEMCSPAYIHHLKELIEAGVFSEEQLDEAVARVLRLKDKLGLFDDPYHGADEARAEALYLSPEHRALARRAATESAVLLKNEGILPFSRDVRRVALIGPFADEHRINGFWSCLGRNEETVTVAEGVARLLPMAEVRTARGCGNEWDDTDTSGFSEATALATWADVVILCLGEPQDYSGEGNCRTDLRLPGQQEALAKAVAAVNGQTAALLFNGRPLALSALDATVPAILEMWFPGTEGGSAAAELLFGVANPCGKLTMSFPFSAGQCPIYYDRVETGRPCWRTVTRPTARYASAYLDCPTLPLYSFGYGLSYTTFTLSDMTVSDRAVSAEHPVTVSVRLKNAGTVDGSEVVQLYMRDPVASVVRPVQKLIAFRKVALRAGEETTISFTVEEPMLRFRNMAGALVSEAGRIDLMLGYADHFAATASVDLFV